MISVLRLGHRVGRDDRISTHVGLTARQWGADEVFFSGDKDEGILESQRDIIDRWGGNMDVKYIESWKNHIREFDGTKVHLTMYGERLNEKQDVLRQSFVSKDFLIVVGSEKVPRWVYENVDFNVSVGGQPHSEIAALAVFMDRISDGGIKRSFEDADIEVEPSEDRKLTRKS